ncbi:MAG: tetratricopeptide repeat protein [Thermoplasmata archaeon]|jgi:tetratricopeptide (TPR) repeat protein/DNA-binding MarR family transcriptional regulator|nr:tetratricopeptide repeat protein [Thermoplasmata archaeon]
MPRLVLSQNERLLLHLWDLDRYRDDPEVPLGASQEGIANRLQIQVHAASRALSGLQEEGLVFDRLAHVRGAPKRRRAYFLTEKGRLAALGMRNDVLKRKVVLEHDGATQELTIEDSIRRIGASSGAPPGLVEIVDVARSNDVVRVVDFGRPAPQPAAQVFVERVQGKPKVESFFGRDSERKALLDALEGSDVSAVLVWGMPGIGKSTFASKAFDELSGKRSMFWYSFREWDTEGSFLLALSEFLSACGRTALSSRSKGNASASEIYQTMVSDLAGQRFVMFLDDVHKLDRQQSTVLPMLLEAVKTSKGCKAVLLSRTVPHFFSRTMPGNFGIELTGLDRDSAWRMAQTLAASDTGRVVDQSHGHPLLINLMARGAQGQAKGDVVDFIEREVYSHLPEVEKNLLELLSIFRHPIRVDAVQDIDYKIVAGLRQKALVLEQQDGIWTHDLLRDFFSSHMSQTRKTALHKTAAAYCESHSGVEWQLEMLYHSVEAGDFERARKAAVSGAQELAKEFPEETLLLVSRIPRGGTAARDHAQLLFLRGQLNESMGKIELALADFEESLSLLGGDVDSDRRALVLETVAKLQSRIQRFSDSLLAHEKALRIYESSGDREGQAREWINIGGVQRRKGDFGRAREAYDKALSLASKAEDRQAQAACLNNLALLDSDQGRLGDAEVKLKESIKLAHVVRDHSGEARGLENLGDLMAGQLRLAEAASVLRESGEAFRRSGEIADSKRVLASSAHVLGGQSRYAEAIELCEKALTNPALRRRRGLFQTGRSYDVGDIALSETLTNLWRAQGDLKKAQREISRFATMADTMNDPGIMAKRDLLSALVSEDSGDLEAAAKSLGEAEKRLLVTGSSEGLIAVHIRSGNVEEKRGDSAAASRHYQEAMRLADAAGDKHAYALALENLNSAKRASA